MNPAVHVLVFEGFADWEPAYALAELRRSGGLDIVTLGFTDAPVRSMGGLRVVPDRALAGLDPAAVRLLILPGGDMWEGIYPRAELVTFRGARHAPQVEHAEEAHRAIVEFLSGSRATFATGRGESPRPPPDGEPDKESAPSRHR